MGHCSSRRTWQKFNCLVLVDPNWAILPVRFRTKDSEPFTIAVTPIDTPEGRWYTLADVLASVLLGGPSHRMCVKRSGSYPRAVAMPRACAFAERWSFDRTLRSSRPSWSTATSRNAGQRAIQNWQHSNGG